MVVLLLILGVVSANTLPQIIRVGAFDYPPFIELTKLNNGTVIASGIEVQVVKTVAESLNMKAKFVEPQLGERWTGVSRDMRHGLVDIGIGKPLTNKGSDC